VDEAVTERPRRRGGWPARTALLALALTALPAAAQDVRGRTTSVLRYVEIQPVGQDTVSRERVTEAADGALTFEGRRVHCTPGLGCAFYRALAQEHALAGSQDLSLTAWGLGVRGLSVTGLVRARVRLAGDFVWPRSDDAFDALLGYAELQRGRTRVRLGRQETLSGLGFRGFDGASARWATGAGLALEGFAGRSLARGLYEPVHEALRGIEDFLPDRNAFLLGGVASARRGGTSVGLRYQREVWSDRSGLLEERASLDAFSTALRPVRLEGTLEWDLALGRLGTSRATVGYPVAGRPLAFEATVRRYVPHFPLYTIWGFFSPVPHHEAMLRATFSPLRRTSAQVAAGWRRYGDSARDDFLTALTDDGRRAEVTVSTEPVPGWTAQAGYRLEWGAGAFLNAADGQLRWRVREGVEVGAMATAFQQILEFRVGEGRVWGGGLTAGLDLPWRARLDGGATVYRHDPRGRAGQTPWSQLRGWTSLGVGFGSDPGAPPQPRLRR